MWGAIASIAGGLLGSKSGGGSQTQTNKMDPRMDRYVYGEDGKGGLLGDAHNLYQQQMKTGGMNPMMQAGLENQRQFLMSPQYSQGYNNLMNMGQGLLAGGVAGNPFTGGGVTRMPTQNMAPFQGQGFTPEMNPAMQGAMNPIMPQTFTPTPLTPPEQSSAAKDEVAALDYMGKSIYEQFKASGLSHEQALEMAKNYVGGI